MRKLKLIMKSRMLFAFRDLKPEENIPPIGYQFITSHMVFDIKVGSLKRKVRYVAGGHMTDPQATATYPVL
jgi:hypothetical protein